VLRRLALAACLVPLACGPLLAGCSGGTSEPSPTSAAASASTPGPTAVEPSPGSSPDIDSGVDEGVTAAEDLPEGWPPELPFYDGRLVSLTISEDGLNVNAVWSSESTPEEAWTEMDSSLRERGFVPTSEAGGEDMLIEDDTMKNDTYVRDGFEANVIVLSEDQTSVLLNASKL
jgi:hypothetical protein